MALQQYRGVLLIIMVVAALLVASPTIETVVVAPQTDHFTEIWLLGPYHNATYPYNVTVDTTYHYYVNVANHLGSCGYYTLEMKFRNQSQSGPDSFNQTASKLPALGSVSFFVADGETLELPLDFSLHYEMKPHTINRLEMQTITLNNETISVESTTLALDTTKWGFYGNLFFELYLFNDTTNSMTYNQRYVSLWLKMETPTF